MSRDAEMLERHGWAFVSRKRKGMVVMAYWHDPVTLEVVRQGYAVIQQRTRNQAKRAAQAARKT